MFTQPAVSPTSTGPGNLVVSPVTAAPASSTPPTRSSRLRGLTYLRNYTQTHILSREHSAHSSTHSTHAPAASNPQPATSTPSPPTITTNPWFSSVRNDHSTTTNTNTTTTPALDNNDSSSSSNNNDNNNTHNNNNNHHNPSSSTRTNRFSHLVPALGQPRRRSPSSSNERGHTGPATGTSSEIRATDAPPAHFPPSSKTGPRITGGNEMTRARSATTGDALGRHDGGSGSLDTLPSIRFSTFVDPRATRPSLKFGPISRTLPSGREVIRVGRYSERDSQPNVPVNAPSAAPVGFKSKVVSRRHCEFWYEDGKWYIKDVKSSSGTFLNHIRLSPPGTESKPYPVNDGDIVQLGIDFKGGEEMIFRCVKMRLELNRGWQNKLNTFNMATHKKLRNMTSGTASTSGAYSQDCSICLNSIAPCQCLFVAPCSHTWHYKCIRSLLSSPSFPIFICPNCRAATDLEAEVEDPEEWEQLESDEGAMAQQGALLQAPSVDPNNQSSNSPRRSRESARGARLFAAQQQQQQQSQPAELSNMDLLMSSSPPRQESPPQLDGAVTLADPTMLSHTLSTPMPIPSPAQRTLPDGRRETRTPSPTGAPVANGHEGPITPRNDAGPWVFDGSGVRLSSESARPAGAVLSQGGDAPPSRATSIEAAVQAAGARLAREHNDS